MNELSKEEKEGWFVEERTNKLQKEGLNKDRMIFELRRKRRNSITVGRTYSGKKSQSEELIFRRRRKKTRTNASYNLSEKKKKKKK